MKTFASVWDAIEELSATNSAWTRYSTSRGVLGSRCPSRSAKRRKDRRTYALVEVPWAPYSHLDIAPPIRRSAPGCQSLHDHMA
jgi:hypothetical protein